MIKLNNTSLNRLFLTSLAIGLGSLAGADTFVREESREYAAKPDQTLIIMAGSGEIEIQRGDSNQVILQVLMSTRADDEIEANERMDAVKIDFSNEDSELRLKIQPGREKKSSWWSGWKRAKQPKINVIATCPPDFNLKIENGSGSISIEGVSGDLSLNTGSGDIRASQIGGRVIGNTGSGNIDVQSLTGSLKAKTGSGDIFAQDLVGKVSASTGSGNVHLRGAVEHFSINTGSGDLSVNSSIAISENSNAGTGSGNIELTLPDSAAFTLTAKSRSGDLECTIPGFQITSQKKYSLAGHTVQDATAISLNTGSGDIRVDTSH